MAAAPAEGAQWPREDQHDRSEDLEQALRQLFDDLAVLAVEGDAEAFTSPLDRALLTAVHQQASLLVAQHDRKMSMEFFLEQEWGAFARSVIIRALASVGHKDAFASEFRKAAAQAQRVHSLKENATFRSVGLLVQARRFSAEIFKDMFGLSEPAVELLVQLSEARLQRGRTANSLALSARERLLIALLHLHNGEPVQTRSTSVRAALPPATPLAAACAPCAPVQEGGTVCWEWRVALARTLCAAACGMLRSCFSRIRSCHLTTSLPVARTGGHSQRLASRSMWG